jgi:N-acetylglutamate synthase-like GNAT family acetyltransferase
MKLIKATTHDLPVIMEIIGHAQNYLASLNIDQWQNGYPNPNAIIKDINNNESYLVQNHTKEVLATAMFSTQNEPTYNTIIGEWLTSQKATYGVIHRMAVHNKYRGSGAAQFIFQECEAYLKQQTIASMRVDTHQDNKGMQQLLNKMGYSYCGIIYLADGNKRLAFEKILS